MLIRTIPFKISPPQGEYLMLMEECANLFNFYTNFCYKELTYNKSNVHKLTYTYCTEQFQSIKSALIQSVRDTALEACKRNKLKGKTPTKHKFSGVRLDSRSFTLRGEQLSLIGITQRFKQMIHVPEYYKEVFTTWKTCGATLNYCKKTKQFWLNVSFKKDNILNQFKDQKVLGIDRGLYNILTLSNGTIINASKIRSIKRKFLFKRRQLQQKGTHSAKRKLKNLSGKEKRFMKDINHCLSKKVVNMSYNIFVIEDLTGIRQQKRKSKKLNQWISNWSFFQFEMLLAYKAQALGKIVTKVSARYTSKKCSCCKNMHSTIRNKSRFKCLTCGHIEHADINAAKNIRDNYILSILPKGTIEQADVNQPNESKMLSIVDSYNTLDSNLSACTIGC